VVEDGKYVITRDTGSYAILKEVEAGRGSPHGGVYLSFQHVPEAQLRAAFGPVIDRLAKNGIDLTKRPVEVAPIAHYHMGGIAVDDAMATGMPGLFAAGEAVGGANGANRLSGNAVTEALVFGRRAGQSAASYAKRVAHAGAADSAAEVLDLLAADAPARDLNTAVMLQKLQAVMQDDVGPLRSAPRLTRAIDAIDAMEDELGVVPPGGSAGGFDMRRLEWLDLRNMLLVARAVASAALARKETRGAQQREDYPQTSPHWAVNQFITLRGGKIALSRESARAEAAAS
jgi:succinate dehydrogenase/fumarate reductase flavoprotein subunit